MDIAGLIPTFGGLLWTLLAFVVALSVIVAVHEFGHYIVGRWSGIQADVFSLGFGPVLLKRTDRRGTVWQLAALPFGGYVKFRGDANAASVGDDIDPEATDEERRHTMYGAPLWARAATVAAGPVFNFILSIVVFTAVLTFRGVASDPLTVETIDPVPYQVQDLLPGDAIVSIGGRTTPALDDFDGYIESLPAKGVLEYDVRRDGREITVRGPYPYPPMARGVSPDSAAAAADIQPGDVILTIDGDPIFTFDQLREGVATSDGGTLLLDVWRDGPDGGSIHKITLAPRRVDMPNSDGGFETRWLIGISGGLFFEPASEMPGPGEALVYGLGQTWFIAKSSVSGLYHMAVGAISSCNLRGPIGIAQTSGQAASQGGVAFIWFIAVLSTAVGLLNLFPVPILDGGHLVFYAYEAAVGRPPSDRALRLLMALGLALLVTLMVFAVSNDLFCP